MTPTAGEGRRGRSIEKRLAILDAARSLFVRDGYELTSVDAIAARADVSKRTVYDHFGDKESIYSAVLDGLGEKLNTTVRAALDAEASEDFDLGAWLLRFARRVVREAFPSSDYADYRALANRRGPWQRDPQSAASAAMELFVDRIVTFAADGVINSTNPRRAAQHFVALTFQLALDTLDRSGADGWDDEVDGVIVDGVRIFMRGYS